MKRNKFESLTTDTKISGETARTDISTGSGLFDVATTHTRTIAIAAPTETIALAISSDITITPLEVSPLENVDVLRLVVSFVGRKQYRFIATISQSFHAAYVQEFPKDKKTVLNASTIEFAKICWEDLKRPSTRQ